MIFFCGHQNLNLNVKGTLMKGWEPLIYIPTRDKQLQVTSDSYSTYE